MELMKAVGRRADEDASVLGRGVADGSIPVTDAAWKLAGLAVRCGVASDVAAAHLALAGVDEDSPLVGDLAGELTSRAVNLLLGPAGLEVLADCARGESFTGWMREVLEPVRAAEPGEQSA